MTRRQKLSKERLLELDRQEKTITARSGPVSTTYACICARDPDACKANTHQERP